MRVLPTCSILAIALAASPHCTGQTPAPRPAPEQSASLRFRIRIDSQMTLESGSTSKRIAANTILEYTCLRKAQLRVVQVDRIRLTTNVDGRVTADDDVTSDRWLTLEDGKLREIRLDAANEQMRTMLGALGRPLYELALGPDGTEGECTTHSTPGSLWLIDSGAVLNTRFFHPPYQPVQPSWEVERALMGAIAAKGKLTYKRSDTVRGDGLVEVEVSGTLRGQGESEGIDHVTRYELSGRQRFDTMAKEWAAGELDIRVQVEMLRDGKAIGSGSGTMAVSLSRIDGPQQFQGTFALGERTVCYEQPKTWTAGRKRPMRAASFEVDRRTDCSVTVLVGTGGGLPVNLDRWRHEMGLAPLTDADRQQLARIPLLGGEATVIRLDGDFEGITGAIKGARLLGVVCPLDGNTVFVKMVGPREEVVNNERAFDDFCRSLR